MSTYHTFGPSQQCQSQSGPEEVQYRCTVGRNPAMRHWYLAAVQCDSFTAYTLLDLPSQLCLSLVEHHMLMPPKVASPFATEEQHTEEVTSQSPRACLAALMCGSAASMDTHGAPAPHPACARCSELEALLPVLDTHCGGGAKAPKTRATGSGSPWGSVDNGCASSLSFGVVRQSRTLASDGSQDDVVLMPADELLQLGDGCVVVSASHSGCPGAAGPVAEVRRRVEALLSRLQELEAQATAKAHEAEAEHARREQAESETARLQVGILCLLLMR